MRRICVIVRGSAEKSESCLFYDNHYSQSHPSPADRQQRTAITFLFYCSHCAQERRDVKKDEHQERKKEEYELVGLSFRERHKIKAYSAVINRSGRFRSY